MADARRAFGNFQLETEFFIYNSFNKGIVLIWDFKRCYTQSTICTNCIIIKKIWIFKLFLKPKIIVLLKNLRLKDVFIRLNKF